VKRNAKPWFLADKWGIGEEKVEDKVNKYQTTVDSVDKENIWQPMLKDLANKTSGKLRVFS